MDSTTIIISVLMVAIFVVPVIWLNRKKVT